MTHAEMIEKLNGAHKAMTDAVARQWRGDVALEISIPARPDHDTDFLVCDPIREVLAALSSAPPDLVALHAEWKRTNELLSARFAREVPRNIGDQELTARNALLAWSPAPPVADTPECAGPFVSAFDCPKCDPRRASPVVAPAPVVEHEDPAIAAKTRAVMAEIAANHFTTVNQCPGLLAFGPIYRALAALSPRETAPGGGR